MSETTVTQGTATFVKKLDRMRGNAALYAMNPPCEGEPFVIVSAVVAFYSGPETYIFPADEHGEVKSWGEMEGSFRGALDHAQALSNAGYVIHSEGMA